MKVEIQKKVTELIAEQIGLKSDEISLESSFEDLNIDSVGLVELVFSIEEYFEINIPFAFLGFEIQTTFKPGICANKVSKLCECCGPCPHPLPIINLITKGTLFVPPFIKNHLAA